MNLKVGKVKKGSCIMLLVKENLLVWDFEHHSWRNIYSNFITVKGRKQKIEDHLSLQREKFLIMCQIYMCSILHDFCDK